MPDGLVDLFEFLLGLPTFHLQLVDDLIQCGHNSYRLNVGRHRMTDRPARQAVGKTGFILGVRRSSGYQ